MAVMHPPGFEPMLASSHRVLGDGQWAFEPKLDGWRAVVHVRVDGVKAYSRPGRDITTSVPTLEGLADSVPVETVLDGELVAGSGRASSFYRLGSLLASRPEHRRATVTFVAFDVLAIEGRCATNLAYQARRRLLEDLGLAGPAWCTATQWTDASPDDLLVACERLDVEGVVAKRLRSHYRPGQRSADWVKIKTAGWRTDHGPYRHKQSAE